MQLTLVTLLWTLLWQQAFAALPWVKGKPFKIQVGQPEQTVVQSIQQEASNSTKASFSIPPAHPITHGAGRCMGLAVGAGAHIRVLRQRFGAESFLVARPEGVAEPSGQIAMHSTLEAMLNCSGGSWLADVSVGDSELAALASSMGCGVFVLDPDEEDSRSVQMTRCVNEPQAPFVLHSASVATDIDVNFSVSTDPMGRPAERLSLLSMRRNLRKRKIGMRSIQGVALDGIFVGVDNGHGVERRIASLNDTANWTGADIALLKITPHGCCGPNETLNALRGSIELLASGRVKVLMTELNFDPLATHEVIDHLATLEASGYQLLHMGPLDAPLDISDEGTYHLFRTNSSQLLELHRKLGRIRSFDERTGQRAYGDGMSLDRKGRYFDYTDVVFAVKDTPPAHLVIKDNGKARFRDGMWWLEEDSSARFSPVNHSDVANNTSHV